MSPKNEIFPTKPQQTFKGKIENRTYPDSDNPEVSQTVDQLTAVMDAGDFILINPDQPVNPALGTVAKQPIIATFKLGGEHVAQIHLVKIVDEHQPSLQDFRLNSDAHKYGDGRLMFHYVDSNKAASAYFPDSFNIANIGKVGNIAWVNYPSGTPELHSRGPIEDAHQLRILKTNHGIMVGDIALPIEVMTRADDDHKEVLKAASEDAEGTNPTKEPRRIGARLLRLSR